MDEWVDCFPPLHFINSHSFLFENEEWMKELIEMEAKRPKAMNEWRNEMDERFHLPRQPQWESWFAAFAFFLLWVNGAGPAQCSAKERQAKQSSKSIRLFSLSFPFDEWVKRMNQIEKWNEEMRLKPRSRGILSIPFIDCWAPFPLHSNNQLNFIP